MENKQADNRINYDSINRKTNKIDCQIDNEKQRIKELDNMRDEFKKYNKTINSCLELLSSVKKKEHRYKYDEMYIKNNQILKKMNSILEEKRSNINDNIKKLYNDKIDLLREKEKNEQKEK